MGKNYSNKINFFVQKKIFLYLQFSGFGGLLNLTALSVVHAIPRFVTGTVWLLPLNDKVNVSNSKEIGLSNTRKKNKPLNFELAIAPHGV